MFEEITAQIKSVFEPDKILLFGSQAKNRHTIKSDIDICVIAPTASKRNDLTRLYLQVEADKPIDFLLYTPEEWESCIKDPLSFAYKINKEGIILYGRQQTI